MSVSNLADGPHISILHGCCGKAVLHRGTGELVALPDVAQVTISENQWAVVSIGAYYRYFLADRCQYRYHCLEKNGSNSLLGICNNTSDDPPANVIKK